MAELVGVCSAYQKSGSCLGACVNSITKKVIISGLDYICVERLADFQKYMPCYKQRCSQMEEQCGSQCGKLTSAEDDWWSQLGLSSKPTSSRRKRADPLTTELPTTSGVEILTTDSGIEDQTPDPSDTCQFVKCYVNCSRPIMEKECGKDAFELLKTTSRILLSFVMTPLEQTWSPTSNTTLFDGTESSTCDGYIVKPRAMATQSDAIRPAFYGAWSILLMPSILLAIGWFY